VHSKIFFGGRKMYKKILVGIIVTTFLLSALPAVAWGSETVVKKGKDVFALGDVSMNKKPANPGGGGGDSTPPTVYFISPTDGENIDAGIVYTIEIFASDDSGIKKVQLLFGRDKYTDSEAPYAWSWDTTGLNGEYTLTAKAEDNARNKAEQTITVNVGGGEPPVEEQELPWGVDRIDADLVADNGAGINVAVLDSGIDNDHEDLNVAGGVNFVAKKIRGKWRVDPNAWDDDNGHGTHVAGTIAAKDNELGVVGVAPDVNLFAVKVLDKNGEGYYSDVIAGIQWSIDNGMDVISMSLGGPDDAALHAVCDAAYAAGIVIVAATGNEWGAVIYPAAYDSVIAVAATDINDAVPGWSNYGPEVDVAAPGVDILSTYKGGGYALSDGTSMATPHVSGAVALLLNSAVGIYDGDSDGTWDPVEVKAKLTGTAEDLGAPGWDQYSGYGLVDAQAVAA